MGGGASRRRSVSGSSHILFDEIQVLGHVREHYVMPGVAHAQPFLGHCYGHDAPQIPSGVLAEHHTASAVAVAHASA